MPRPDMLALPDSALDGPASDWSGQSPLSLYTERFPLPSYSFSFNARGVNVMVGNIYEAFLGIQKHCRARIFFTRVLFEDIPPEWSARIRFMRFFSVES